MRVARIQAALCAGCMLYGAKMPDGTIVMSIEEKGRSRGYGNGNTIRDVLKAVDDNLSNMTGLIMKEECFASEIDETRIMTLMDEWMQQGLPGFIAWQDDKNIIFWLSGTRTVCVPNHILDLVMITGTSVTWPSDRGYIYVTSPDPEQLMVGPISTIVRSSPNVKGDDGFGWQYPVIKIGTGKSFWQAIERALNVEEVEVRL